MNYADAFKSLRHAYGLTQVEFAELLRVSKPTIQKLEAGDYPPSEKITVRLAELFRSEKFRSEFRSRVETGDLCSVGVAFGDLLGFVDAEESTSLPLSSPVSAPSGNMADAYADLRKDYAEFREIVRSQQDTIRDLSASVSESNKNLSVSNKNLSESTKSFAVSTENFSETAKNLSESNKNLSESVKSLAEGRVAR